MADVLRYLHTKEQVWNYIQKQRAFRSSGKWRRVSRLVSADVSKERSASSSVEGTKKNKHMRLAVLEIHAQVLKHVYEALFKYAFPS